MVEITGEMARDSITAIPLGVDPTRSQVREVVEIRRTALERVRNLEAPADFALEHAALLAALDNLVAASDGFLEATAELDADQFLGALIASGELNEFTETVATVCRIWETRAAEAGHQVDLGC